MTKPMIRIHNTETNEIIDREMNADELKQWELDKAKSERDLAEAEAKAQAKNDLLTKLGITADEAALLLG